MLEIIAALIGGYLAWLAGRHIQLNQSRLERTLQLVAEFYNDQMQIHRYKLWLRRCELFKTQISTRS
jgi:hypothetical protein